MTKQNVLETIYINIAGFKIEINFYQIDPPFLVEKSFRDRMLYYCYGFLSPPTKKSDFTINFKSQLYLDTYIKTDQKKFYISIYQLISLKKMVSYYHLSEDYIKLILRTICQLLLAQNNGMLFHSSASLINNQANFFLGDSGAGKSTIVNLLSYEFKPLADDIIILKKEKEIYYFYQTPFREKNLWITKNPNRIPLSRVFFLKKSTTNKLEKVTNQQFILNNFLKQFLTDQKDYQKQLPNITQFLKRFQNFYILHFSLDHPKELVSLLKK